MPYNWNYRIYRNGKDLSATFDELVPDKVTIRLHRIMKEPHTDTRTPFKEVSIMPYKIPKTLAEFMDSMKIKESTIDDMWQAIKTAIFENWMQDKIHVIGSSSGYDSRLIAKAIVELTREHGKEWLGESYFIECGGEGNNFAQIMNTLGITNYIIWEPEYDYDYFERLHERFNGICAFPVNQWYDYYVKNWDEEDIQYISGYGGNIADMFNDKSWYQQPVKLGMTPHQRLIHYFKYQYYYQIAAFKKPKYSLHPFYSYRYIEAAAGFKHNYGRTAELLTKVLVSEVNHIKRMTINGDVRKIGFRQISNKTITRLHEWYRSTAYGKKNPVIPDGRLDYNFWWLHLCLANYIHYENKVLQRR